jgi:Uma2 family endonuclease
MASNTVQARHLMSLFGGFSAVYQNRPDVFVAIDLFWYPVEGDNQMRVAPDVMVVFGRPKDDRKSYLQWKEDNIPPQVVFEILSESNTVEEMLKKFDFYQRFGVEEYYLYDSRQGKPDGRAARGFYAQIDREYAGLGQPSSANAV